MIDSYVRRSSAVIRPTFLVLTTPLPLYWAKRTSVAAVPDRSLASVYGETLEASRKPRSALHLYSVHKTKHIQIRPPPCTYHKLKPLEQTSSETPTVVMADDVKGELSEGGQILARTDLSSTET